MSSVSPDPAFWESVEEHCRALGARFKFVREDNLQGFKAGALRIAIAGHSAGAYASATFSTKPGVQMIMPLSGTRAVTRVPPRRTPSA